jgi:hypothetical protein
MVFGEARPYKYLGRREEDRERKEAWSRREKNGGGRRGGLPDRRQEQIREVGACPTGDGSRLRRCLARSTGDGRRSARRRTSSIGGGNGRVLAWLLLTSIPSFYQVQLKVGI